MQRWKNNGKILSVAMAILLVLALMAAVGGCGGGGGGDGGYNDGGGGGGDDGGGDDDDGGGGDDGGGDGSGMGTLTVRVFLPSYDDNGDYKGIAGPAPSGVIINVNSIEYGLTGDDGTLTVQVPAGELEVDARRYPGEGGGGSVVLEPGGHAQVDIVIHEKEIAENSTLMIDQLKSGVLDRDFDALTLRFISQAGKPVVLNEVAWVQLLDPRGGPDTFVEQLFTLRPDGSVILNDVAAFKNLLFKRSGKILLNAKGYETDERAHHHTLEFYVGSYKIVGQLVAPPSNPDLSVAGIEISANLMDTGLVFNAVSDASGHFELPPLPAGHLSFTGKTVQDGKCYYGKGTLVVDGSKLMTVNMLHVSDILNGVPSFTDVPLPGSFSTPEMQPDPERERLHQLREAEFLNEWSSVASADVPGTDSVSVNVVAKRNRGLR
jgi:hypothetical protein